MRRTLARPSAETVNSISYSPQSTKVWLNVAAAP